MRLSAVRELGFAEVSLAKKIFPERYRTEERKKKMGKGEGIVKEQVLFSENAYLMLHPRHLKASQNIFMLCFNFTHLYFATTIYTKK